ncbi:RNA-directed DNA polymerase from mobile element jockey [Trichonephila clavipes]|nr:RNA-directed DNA polymerase from mobile element jockey [Trichonephila clavipes]
MQVQSGATQPIQTSRCWNQLKIKLSKLSRILRDNLKIILDLLSTNRNRASRPIAKRALGPPRHPNSIPTGKDPTLAESHRPISLLPILSKLAEKIISTRLNDFLETNKILIPEQHGFRPRLSTTHQLLRVVEYIKEGNNMGQCTAAVFLDIQKAFDRVWHSGLLFKLINYNIPTPLILLLNSYISNRSFTVKINRTYSQTRSISAGVAQGSILGPVLFNLYVNDILKSTNTMLCMYADDTAILSRHKNLNTLVENINEHLAHLEIWFSVWKIALNSTKTEAVFFSQSPTP